MSQDDYEHNVGYVRKEDTALLTKNILIDIHKSDFTIKELIKGVSLADCLNEQGDVLLSKLLDKLKHHYNAPIESKPIVKLDHQILYYLPKGQIYVNCGNDPVNEDIAICRQDIDHLDLTIKTNEVPISLIHKLMSEEVNETMMQERQNQEGEKEDTNKCRRTKERRIGFIIDKVVKWRQYYTGMKEEGSDKVNRLSLEDAALKVGISKKSLDDYLLQIRFGRRYGFNFNQHKNDKVGVLRDYVRKSKKTNKTDKKPRKADKKNKQEDSD